MFIDSYFLVQCQKWECCTKQYNPPIFISKDIYQSATLHTLLPCFLIKIPFCGFDTSMPWRL